MILLELEREILKMEETRGGNGPDEPVGSFIQKSLYCISLTVTGLQTLCAATEDLSTYHLCGTNLRQPVGCNHVSGQKEAVG